jgi:uncharacterized protein (TIGR03435 family)
MKQAGKLLLFVASIAFAVAPLLSETKPQAASPKPTFEVVSVKPSPQNLNIRGGGPRGNSVITTGTSLRNLLQQAYSKSPVAGGPIQQIQIIGGPNWIDSDLYDINAKADCSNGPIPREQMQLMMQSMLEDRFKLKARTETRELPVYNLVLGRDGSKMKMSEDQNPANVPVGPPLLCGPAPPPLTLPAPPPPPAPGGPGAAGFTAPALPRGALRMMIQPTGMMMQGSATPFGNFVNMLSQFSGRPVIDKTGLKGLVDFTLQFSREGITLPGLGGGPPPPGLGPGGLSPGGPGGPGGPADAAEPVPSLFTAIQELGLRLESTKGPVEVLVVESAEKPTEN